MAGGCAGEQLADRLTALPRPYLGTYLSLSSAHTVPILRDTINTHRRGTIVRSFSTTPIICDAHRPRLSRGPYEDTRRSSELAHRPRPPSYAARIRAIPFPHEGISDSAPPGVILVGRTLDARSSILQARARHGHHLHIAIYDGTARRRATHNNTAVTLRIQNTVGRLTQQSNVGLG